MLPSCPPCPCYEAGHGIHFDLRLDKEIDYLRFQSANKASRAMELIGNRDPRELSDSESIKIESLFKEAENLRLQANEMVDKIIPFDIKWKNTLEKDYSDLDLVNYETSGGRQIFEWNLNNAEVDKSITYLIDKTEIRNIRYSPLKGFVSPYGSSNIKEDIATYREKVIGDPSFFKRYGLLDDSKGNIMYHPAYKQKIDLLLEYGFITDKEYEAVFHPEKYGLK